MSNNTKACNLTEEEINTLIAGIMAQTLNIDRNLLNLDDTMERLNYLHKRLKAFKEPNAIKTTTTEGWPTNG